MFFRSYLPTWAGGASASHSAKTSPRKLAGMSLGSGNSRSLASITNLLDKAQSELVGWVDTFQAAHNQIKLPEDMSPTAKSLKENKAEVPPAKQDTKTDEKSNVSATKPSVALDKESVWHLPDTRIQGILQRTVESINSDHETLLKLTNQSPSFFKPMEKDREIHMGQLAITLARKLRDMIDDIQLVITECLLDEEIGAKLVRAAPALISLPAVIVASVLSDSIVQQAKELGDQLLKKHIQKSIDQIQDHLNKFTLDFMKVNREMSKRIEEIKRRQGSLTPDKPDIGLRLTIPSNSL